MFVVHNGAGHEVFVLTAGMSVLLPRYAPQRLTQFFRDRFRLRAKSLQIPLLGFSFSIYKSAQELHNFPYISL
jgi:hypothetical protein